MTQSKPVLISGATGSIGFALARRLTRNGQAVRALVRNPGLAYARSDLAWLLMVQGRTEESLAEALPAVVCGRGRVARGFEGSTESRPTEEMKSWRRAKTRTYCSANRELSELRLR